MAEVLLTKKGFEDLQNELKNLKEVERPQVVLQLKEARAQGDLSENADYDAARNKQAQIEGRIIQIEGILSNARLIEDEKGPLNIVKLNTTVTIERVDTGKQASYTIVGTVEANSLENKISNECPLAKAILGKPVGPEEITVKAVKSYKVRIVDIKR